VLLRHIRCSTGGMSWFRTALVSSAYVFCLTCASSANAATLTVLWDPSPGSNVAGYVVYWGTQSGVHGSSLDVGNQLTTQVTGLADATAYYFVVRAYDETGMMSDPSGEATGHTAATTNPTSAPTISCPLPTGTSSDGGPVAVTFQPSLSGGASPVTASCSPSSGSLFGIGTTSLQCGAVDALNRTVSCTSAVVVSGPPPPAAPKFAIGDRVAAYQGTQFGVGVVARDVPSISGSILGAHGPGELGTVTSGPQVASGYTWWQVNYDNGADGWSTQTNLDKSSSPAPLPPPPAPEPAPAPPAPAPPAPPATAKFALGDRVAAYTGTQFGLGVVARNLPSISATILGAHAPGELGTVTMGPQSGNGYTWWQVNYDSGADGWSTETNLERSVTPPPVPPTPPPSTGKFIIGNRVSVYTGTQFGVGAAARHVASLSGSILAVHAPRELGTVTMGPLSSGGYTWWWINYDTGADGWSTETNLDKSIAPPPTTAPPPPALAIMCPDPTATSPLGFPVIVNFGPTVNGGLAPVGSSCSPASGSLFPVGTTPLTCTAVDAARQVASCSATVVVTKAQRTRNGKKK
jgi:hypothetical protein